MCPSGASLRADTGVRGSWSFGNLGATWPASAATVVRVSSGKGRLSRRGFLIGGLGSLASGCATPETGAAPGTSDPPPVAESLSRPAVPNEPVTIETVHSPARDAGVELVTIRPAGVGGRLPTCVALHGRASSARMFVELGVPELLTKAVNAGVKPFAVVAVDGGDSYWVAKKPRDDPQKMLTEDLPTWLANRGFTAPFAAFGISMGGYGALNFARVPGLSAVAAISAALFTSWADAKSRNAFADEARWEATEPLRHTDELAGIQLGVWCGERDPFITPARELISKARPQVSAIGPGGHDSSYWKRILPQVLTFVGSTVP